MYVKVFEVTISKIQSYAILQVTTPKFVKTYDTTNIYLVLSSPFLKQNIFFYVKNTVACYNASVIFVNAAVVGLAPGVIVSYVQLQSCKKLN
jgi:hypothetical protein